LRGGGGWPVGFGVSGEIEVAGAAEIFDVSLYFPSPFTGAGGFGFDGNDAAFLDEDGAFGAESERSCENEDQGDELHHFVRLFSHKPLVEPACFEGEFDRDEVVAEGVGPAFGLAKGVVVFFQLRFWEDAVQGAGNHQDTLIPESGGEGSSVEFGHGGGLAIDFEVFVVSRNAGDLGRGIFPGIGDPIEGVGEDLGGSGGKGGKR
jgi:hypothetical protein